MKRFKNIFFATLFFVVASFGGAAQAITVPPPPDRASAPVGGTVEAVRSFAADISVIEDGRIKVREQIDYFFPEPRHGIFRYLPIDYRDDAGKNYRIPIDEVTVTDGEGRPVPFEESRRSHDLMLKIGDPNATLSGLRTYVISYVASGALRYFSDHDELYWNVTGTEWEVPIERAAAVVHLPNSVKKPDWTKCFTGDKGSTASDCRAAAQGNRADFAASGNLTVVVAWPTGLVAKLEAEPSSSWPSRFPYVLALTFVAALFVYWWYRGRDPDKGGSIVVQYDAPAGLTAAETGVLMDESVHPRDITAAIVDLAMRGHLKIKEVEKSVLVFKSRDYEFIRQQPTENAAALRPYEESLLWLIFEGAESRTMYDIKRVGAGRRDLAKRYKAVQRQLYEEVTTKGVFDGDPSKVRQRVGVIGGFVSAGLFGVAIAVQGKWAATEEVSNGILGALIIVAIGCSIFAWLMPRKTPAGVALWRHAKGFKDYLATAEKYRLQWQEKENVFEKFLPYAMVFGVAKKWAAAFADVSQPPPSWYEGSAMHAAAFNAVAFESALSSMGSSFGSAVSSATSGSGSSGSSGGGGGGGGGGSW